jgi:NitT/TauT family transport system permease protein
VKHRSGVFFVYNEAMKKVAIWLTYALVWELGARLVDKAILLPSFTHVMSMMVLQAQTASLWLALGQTLGRVVVGTGIALGLALILSVSAERYTRIKPWLHPLIIITKTIPNITYILLVLIWFSREMTVTVITLLILFPVLYSHLSTAIDTVMPTYLDLSKLYPERFVHRVRHVILPLIGPHIVEGVKTAIALGFKVGVMAELLGQVQPGLGYLMHLARQEVDTPALFAYTGWMILIVVVIEKGIGRWGTPHD